MRARGAPCPTRRNSTAPHGETSSGPLTTKPQPCGFGATSQSTDNVYHYFDEGFLIGRMRLSRKAVRISASAHGAIQMHALFCMKDQHITSISGVQRRHRTSGCHLGATCVFSCTKLDSFAVLETSTSGMKLLSVLVLSNGHQAALDADRSPRTLV
jgi:hypothetical protein